MPDILKRIQAAVDAQGARPSQSPVLEPDKFHDADVPRREPVYEPRITVEYALDERRTRFPTPDTFGADKVIPPRQNDAGYRIAYPQREAIVTGRFKRSGNGTTDGTGAASFTVAQVPPNQTWLIDRIVARVAAAGAAAGVAVVYEGSAANDDGVLCVLPLGAPNVFQIDGNPVEVGPGQTLLAAFTGAGTTNGAVATVRVFYRIIEYVPGRSEDTTP